ncbi:kinase domain protein (macronuclear) [Tetrahymena thermophila SB210]|uniref:Kinase domain protein n=1 Tax=Tetrahymena thermophila (strain SB210) TaxID=312017 RepID=Q22N99_TETTS|nr:kinase domain protein [Tetrahymena thermophila SB210]EAR86886.3 kinase domain protein [Tetrahymena thermophila SB210]|eukprot:XP_001007131.3 kinase domain protein [Tetrahymena thermophila SB210]
MISQQNSGPNRFNLVYDYIDERDLSLLEPVVKCIPTLSSFELRFHNYSRIGKKGTQKISEALSISQKMNSFKLYLNKLRIGNEAIVNLSQGISNCLNLQSIVLNLHDNMMNCLSFQKLCEQIAKCEQLKALDLDVSQNYILSNEQSSQALQIIFTMIPNLKFLSLNLSNNQLETNNKTPCLFIYLYKCINLEYLCLNLEKTGIIQEEVYQIGHSIQEIKILKDIQLQFQKQYCYYNPIASSEINNLMSSSFSKVADGINSYSCYFDQQCTLRMQKSFIDISFFCNSQREGMVRNFSIPQNIFVFYQQEKQSFDQNPTNQLSPLPLLSFYLKNQLKLFICQSQNYREDTDLSELINTINKLENLISLELRTTQPKLYVLKLYLFLYNKYKNSFFFPLELCSKNKNVWQLKKDQSIALVVLIQNYRFNDQKVKIFGLPFSILNNAQENISKIYILLVLFLSSSLQSHEDLLIHLRSNKIGDTGAQKLGSALQKCTKLKHLQLFLQYNEISKIGAQILGEGLATCSFLTKLIFYFSYNTVESQGAISLGQSLAKCANLKTLTFWIQCNEIDGQGALDFGSALANCANLQILVLNINGNNTQKEDRKKLIFKLKKMKRLVKLSF